MHAMASLAPACAPTSAVKSRLTRSCATGSGGTTRHLQQPARRFGGGRGRLALDAAADAVNHTSAAPACSSSSSSCPSSPTSAVASSVFLSRRAAVAAAAAAFLSLGSTASSPAPANASTPAPAPALAPGPIVPGVCDVPVTCPDQGLGNELLKRRRVEAGPHRSLLTPPTS